MIIQWKVTNRVQGIRSDRVPDELWTEVHDIVQETGIKTIPEKKKCKKAKWLSEEALKIAVKRREVKSKGEKERCTHLNAEFQRIARRDKKALLSNQWKEIEKNNRMGKTRELFKKIIDIKGTFHANMGSIKGIYDRDLTEAEDIKKRWQEYTEELYKKGLNDPDNHDGVITDLEPDILECEVKWALESITMNKVSGGDGIPVELFQILKDDAVKVLHSICQQIRKTQQWPQDWKRSVFIPIPKKGNAKECSNYHTIALIIDVSSVQFSLVAQSCPTLCYPMNRGTPGLPVHHQLPEFTQTHVHQVGDDIQPSYPLSSPFTPALNPSQHQGLFQ